MQSTKDYYNFQNRVSWPKLYTELRVLHSNYKSKINLASSSKYQKYPQWQNKTAVHMTTTMLTTAYNLQTQPADLVSIIFDYD